MNLAQKTGKSGKETQGCPALTLLGITVREKEALLGFQDSIIIIYIDKVEF